MLLIIQGPVVPFNRSLRGERSLTFYYVDRRRVEVIVYVVGKARDPSGIFRVIAVRVLCLPAGYHPAIASIVGPRRVFHVSAGLRVVAVCCDCRVVRLMLPNDRYDLMCKAFALLAISRRRVNFVVPLVRFDDRNCARPSERTVPRNSDVRFGAQGSSDKIPQGGKAVLPRYIRGTFDRRPSKFRHRVRDLRAVSLARGRAVPRVVLEIAYVCVRRVGMGDDGGVRTERISASVSNFYFVSGFGWSFSVSF